MVADYHHGMDVVEEIYLSDISSKSGDSELQDSDADASTKQLLSRSSDNGLNTID